MAMKIMPKSIQKLLRARSAEVVAWRLGAEAGRARLPISANPYQNDLATDWLDGHAEGAGTIPEATRLADL